MPSPKMSRSHFSDYCSTTQATVRRTEATPLYVGSFTARNKLITTCNTKQKRKIIQYFQCSFAKTMVMKISKLEKQIYVQNLVPVKWQGVVYNHDTLDKLGSVDKNISKFEIFSHSPLRPENFVIALHRCSCRISL